jgi:hypothetical protein
MLEKRSSETLCEVLKFDTDFLSWFVGFTEGDGCFSLTGKRGYLEFKITQSSHDAQVLFYIKKKLGFGSVTVQDKQNKTHHFRVRDKKNLLILISIFNGKFLTEKKQLQFKKWLVCFKERYGTNVEFNPNYNFDFLTLNSSWISGFTDAEGCFTVSAVERSPGYTQIHVRFILSQKGEKELLEKIALLLNGRLYFLKSYEGYNLVVTLSKLKKVIHYFSKIPLRTKKHIGFLNWLKVYNLVQKKEHLTSEGLLKVKELISKINKKF